MVAPDMTAALKGTCHTGSMTGVAFPLSTSEILPSCALAGCMSLCHIGSDTGLPCIETPNE
jgi:hypothetical protein